MNSETGFTSAAVPGFVRPVLPPGALLRVVAPASPAEPGALDHACRYFTAKGFQVQVDPQVYRRDRYLAGGDRVRADAINAAFADPAVGGILTARGGYGSARLLDRLDYDVIRNHPKPLVGFSDLTALQLALLARSGLCSFSGVALQSDFKEPEPAPLTGATLWSCLNGQPLSFPGLKAIRSGCAEGPLIGGCLALLAALMGTPYLPPLRGAILFVEDVGEEPYRADRLLTQLRLGTLLDEVAAVVVGRFERCVARDPRDGTIDDVLAELPRLTPAPRYTGLPYGHFTGRCVLPLGAPARIECAPDGGCLLRIPG